MSGRPDPPTTGALPDDPGVMSGRVLRLALGIAINGPAFCMVLHANLGLGPWHVFQVGMSEAFDVSVGTASWLLGFGLAVCALMLGQRPGPGTLVVILAGGAWIDVMIRIVPIPEMMAIRWLFLLAGTAGMALAGALMIWAHIGTAPLDALMTGLYQRSPIPLSLSLVRLILECVGLVLGVLAGGTAGVGSVVVGLTIGPAVHGWMHLLGAMPARMLPVEHPPVTVVGADVIVSELAESAVQGRRRWRQLRGR